MKLGSITLSLTMKSKSKVFKFYVKIETGMGVVFAIYIRNNLHFELLNHDSLNHLEALPILVHPINAPNRLSSYLGIGLLTVNLLFLIIMKN